MAFNTTFNNISVISWRSVLLVAVDDVSKVVIGHSTSLQCAATGIPIPDIEWYKDGRLLVYSSRIQTENNGQQLNIINATVENTGNYTSSMAELIACL
jgi:hypothetical protein